MSSSRLKLSSGPSSGLQFLVVCALIGCAPEATSDGVGASDASPPLSSDASRSDEAPAARGRASDAADPRATVVFLGNSLTAGLGVRLEEAYPALVQARIDAADLPFRVVNAGISGETTAGGLRRIDWVLEQSPAVLVLALGANDALRGAPPDSVRSNLQQIVDRTRERFPETRIVIAGMLAPPNMGKEYANAFRGVFTSLAAENGATLVPFLLEGVAADRALNQPDGIHPTAEGHEVIADTVWEALGEVLRVAAEATHATADAGAGP